MLNQNPQRLNRGHFLLISSIVSLALCGLAASTPQSGESEKTGLQPADYTKWESLRFGASISPNGKWLACPISRGDGTSRDPGLLYEAGVR